MPEINHQAILILWKQVKLLNARMLSYRNLPQSSDRMVLVVSKIILSLVVFKRRILTMPYRTVPCWHGKIVLCKRVKIYIHASV